MKSGFSLLELLCCLAIIGILTTLCYSSYQPYLARSRRIDGYLALLHLAGQMERYYQTHHTYQTATIASGLSSDVLTNADSEHHWYQISIVTASTNNYMLLATAQGTQAIYDTACPTILFQKQHSPLPHTLQDLCNNPHDATSAL